ncbi:hypothetical protein GF312_04010 [Candidatus Poribacteria bacterium]|nr:hypothetical protein [Candidatus Poribacteria bacterium]
MSSQRIACIKIFAMIILLTFFTTNICWAKDVYSLFGKLFLSGRVEYDFTNTRDFIADTEEQYVEQDRFDFDRLFRRGFYSVLTIEETAGNIKNILSLGDVPSQFTSYTFNRDDLAGVRWDVRSDRVDVSFLLVPGPLNPVIGQEVPESGVGLRQVTKFGNSKVGGSWYFRQTPVFGLDAETNFANYGLKLETAVTPKSTPHGELMDKIKSTALLLEAYRTVGDIIIRGEAFRIGDNYDASRSVADNDDQDRYTDNTSADPPSFIIPGDLDKNDNGVFDYKDDILLFDVDEDFLDERDENNNGIRDQEENDHDPDYDFDVGLTGIKLSMEYKTSRRGVSRNLDTSLQYAIKGDSGSKRQKSIKVFFNGQYRRNILNLGSLVAENELKYVQDDIPDPTWHYAATVPNEVAEVMKTKPEFEDLIDSGELEFFYIGRVAEIEILREDPVLMQKDIIDTVKGTFEYTGIKKMVTTARLKLQYDLDLDGDNKHYEVGIIKTNYRVRPSKSIEIIPMYKYKIRNGFKMAEEKDVITFLEWTNDEGEEKDYTVRLRTIDNTDVRDQMHAFILKTVYQFTKTIKITGGLQLLLFNNMKNDKDDFTRQAVLGELEKNFVAYDKDLFLHIGVKYINQKAKGEINDQNYMETFVRVFAKF